jgi:single-stranded DNA-binding protein
MEVSGRIKVIGETQTFGANGFRKRELVVETFDQYPQSILIEFVQDNVNVLDQYQLAQEVRVFINIRGREWVNPEGVTKYFNSIQGWRMEPYQQAQAQQPQGGGYAQQPQGGGFNAQPAAPQAPTNPVGGESKEDDLPF